MSSVFVRPQRVQTNWSDEYDLEKGGGAKMQIRATTAATITIVVPILATLFFSGEEFRNA
jgi:hypothetical protein